MGFLRRLRGSSAARTPEGGAPGDDQGTTRDGDADAAEAAYELDLLRAEQERLDDLRQRQLRYAQYAWTPPAEGGTRRADDTDAGE